MLNDYYVYEWIRLDTNEPFYIGKGRGRRAYSFNNRGKYFRDVVKNIPCAVVILEENLTEDEAFKTECWYIWQLRDVQGYWLVNITDGGEGTAGMKHKEDSKEKISKSGKKAWKDEKRKINLSNKLKQAWKNEEYRNQQKISRKGKHAGEKNAMFGKTGKDHPGSKPVIIFKDDEFYGKFESIKDAAIYLQSKIGGKLENGIQAMVNKGWKPKRGQLAGFSAKYDYNNDNKNKVS